MGGAGAGEGLYGEVLGAVQGKVESGAVEDWQGERFVYFSQGQRISLWKVRRWMRGENGLHIYYVVSTT